MSPPAVVQRSLAGNVSARRLERAKLREAAQRIPSPRRGSTILVNAFFDDALWSIIIAFLSPAEVVLFGRVCQAAHERTVGRWASWWFGNQAEYLLPMRLTAALAPRDGDEWTWERLHLCAEPLLEGEFEPVIEFTVASDRVSTSTCRSAAMVAKLDALATQMRRHPRLRLRLLGHGAPDAPSIYGGPISQARATRVRSELLLRLRGHPAWSADGPPSLGRGPEHMDDKDIEDTYLLYAEQKPVGSKVQAIGMWQRDEAYFATQPLCGGQCAEVRIVGFDDAIREV